MTWYHHSQDRRTLWGWIIICGAVLLGVVLATVFGCSAPDRVYYLPDELGISDMPQETEP